MLPLPVNVLNHISGALVCTHSSSKNKYPFQALLSWSVHTSASIKAEEGVLWVNMVLSIKKSTRWPGWYTVVAWLGPS